MGRLPCIIQVGTRESHDSKLGRLSWLWAERGVTMDKRSERCNISGFADRGKGTSKDCGQPLEPAKINV